MLLFIIRKCFGPCPKTSILWSIFLLYYQAYRSNVDIFQVTECSGSDQCSDQKMSKDEENKVTTLTPCMR